MILATFVLAAFMAPAETGPTAPTTTSTEPAAAEAPKTDSVEKSDAALKLTSVHTATSATPEAATPPTPPTMEKKVNTAKVTSDATAIAVVNGVAYVVLMGGAVVGGLLVAPVAGPGAALAVALPVVGVPIALLVTDWVLSDSPAQFGALAAGTMAGHYVGLLGGSLAGAFVGTAGYGGVWALGCLGNGKATDACGFALLGFPLAAAAGGVLGAGLGGTIGAAAGGAVGAAAVE